MEISGKKYTDIHELLKNEFTLEERAEMNQAIEMEREKVKAMETPFLHTKLAVLASIFILVCSVLLWITGTTAFHWYVLVALLITNFVTYKIWDEVWYKLYKMKYGLGLMLILAGFSVVGDADVRWNDCFFYRYF